MLRANHIGLADPDLAQSQNASASRTALFGKMAGRISRKSTSRWRPGGKGQYSQFLVSALQRHLASPSQMGPFALLSEDCNEPEDVEGTVSTILIPTKQRQADGFSPLRRVEGGRRSQHLYPLVCGVDELLIF